MQIVISNITAVVHMIHATIIGGSGYSGAELIRILSRCGDVSIRQVTAQSSAGCTVAGLYPDLSGVVDIRYDTMDSVQTDGLDVLFIALPSGQAKDIVEEYIDTGVRIIDLGGDFRLPDKHLYEIYYGTPHNHPRLLGTSVYGLPELNRTAIHDASLIANPGCYPTSVIIALYPLLKESMIDAKGIVINSLSGVSGAGRKASVPLSFSEVNENVKAYKVTRHQHIPEIKSVLDDATGKDISFSFVPHLIPITRGIYTTIHANIDDSITGETINSLYNNYFANEPFVRIVDEIPAIKNVTGTNYCDLYCTIQENTGHVIIISVIDNLLKGAAGQAVQNMNIMFDYPETQGLL